MTSEIVWRILFSLRILEQENSNPEVCLVEAVSGERCPKPMNSLQRPGELSDLVNHSANLNCFGAPELLGRPPQKCAVQNLSTPCLHRVDVRGQLTVMMRLTARDFDSAGSSAAARATHGGRT